MVFHEMIERLMKARFPMVVMSGQVKICHQKESAF